MVAACASPAPPAAAPATQSAPTSNAANPAANAPAAAATPAVAPAAQPTVAAAQAGEALPSVPRNATLISAGWDSYNQVPSPTNFNPYLNVLQHARNNLHYTLNESLFYTNTNDGTVIPWLAKSADFNADFTEVTLKLHPMARWADGQPYTASDVAFTIDMLKKSAPALSMSTDMVEWVKQVTVKDPQTAVITLNKPGPRWVKDYLQNGQAARFIVLPEHAWKDQDPKSFAFYDPTKGQPFGTGPYKLVKSGSDSIVFDRADKWWALDAGLAKAMPAAQRIIYKPSSPEAQAQLYINNDIDVGGSLQIGTFQAAQARNPKLITWASQGTALGAPDGCNYRLLINNQSAPYDDRDVRWALNDMLNRSQIVQLAYEGSTHTNVAPFASYGGIQKYVSQMGELFTKYDVDHPDNNKAAQLLTAKGFKKDSNGVWVKPDGSPWPVTIIVGEQNPIGPVIQQQLKTAGLDVVTNTLQNTAFTDALSTGSFDLAAWVICGSNYDPWQTLNYYNGKYAPAVGEKATQIRAVTRYSNPELDGVLAKMESMEPSPDNPAYMNLVRQATEIYLRDLPDIVLAEELQVTVFDTNYWTGWPTASDPYMPPFIAWDGFAQVINRLMPAQ